jgi:hypothetical protein
MTNEQQKCTPGEKYSAVVTYVSFDDGDDAFPHHVRIGENRMWIDSSIELHPFIDIDEVRKTIAMWHEIAADRANEAVADAYVNVLELLTSKSRAKTAREIYDEAKAHCRDPFQALVDAGFINEVES